MASNEDFAKSIGAVPEDAHSEFASSIGATPESAPSAQANSEDPRGFANVAQKAYTGTVNLLGNAAAGAIDAGSHPLRTAGELVDTAFSPITDPMGTLAGAYRTVRNVPVIGSAIDESAKSAVALGNLLSGKSPQASEQSMTDFAQRQSQGDAKHAQDHPLTDFIQRSAGMAALPQTVIGASATLATDAFARSLNAGNSVTDALTDARNVGILSGLAMKGGQLGVEGLKSGWGKLGELGRAAPAEAGAIAGPVESMVAPAEASPIPNFPSKADLAASLRGRSAPLDSPEASLASPVKEPLPLPANASTLPQAQSHLFETLGAAAGGTGGTFLGHHLGGLPGAGMLGTGGTFAGKALGSQLDKLAATYGADAINAVRKAGIPLENFAGSQYIAPLMHAAQQGNVPLAVTYYMMQQKDPSLQQAVGQ